MNVNQWERAKEIFDAALKLPIDERSQFVTDACHGDEPLLLEVSGLLDADDQATSFLKTPAIRLYNVFDIHSLADRPHVDLLPEGELISGRFEIKRLLGQGGMGQVYEARDTELGVRVALKTIRPDISSDERASFRFKREVQLTRRVTHPNVCRIFDLGRHTPHPESGHKVRQEFSFLTMELLEGETLADLLRRKGRLDVAEALPIIEQVAEGLAAAHKLGIVHRDIKPSNVVLVPSEDHIRVVVTDFGLARAVASPGNDTVSQLSNRVVGTLAYMAPEQLAGAEVTPATDTYAFGLVIYEMVTGVRPFDEDLPLGGVAQRLKSAPASPRAHLPELDVRWDAAILRCLQVDPAARFQSPLEVVDAIKLPEPSLDGDGTKPSDGTSIQLQVLPLLRRLLALGKWRTFGLASLLLVAAATVFVIRHNRISSVSRELSIAVLPFVEESGGVEKQYLGEELSNEIIATLSRVPALSVIARNSSFSISDSNLDLKTAAHQLHTRYLVTGSVRYVDNRVQIAARLIDPPNNRILWSQTFQRDRTQTAALHAEIVRGITSRLGIQVSGAQLAVFDLQVPPEAAIALYMRGRTLWATRSPKNLSEALELFTQSIAIDPTFAAAYAARADTLAIMAERSYLAASTAVPQAKEAALHALILDPQLPEAHAALGLVQDTGEWDFYNAEKSLQRAIQLSPSYVYSHQWYAAVLLKIGRSDEAIREAETAAQLDPLSPAALASVGWMNYYSQKYDSTLLIADDLSKEYPRYPDVCMLRADTMIAKRAFAEALRALAICAPEIRGTPLYLRSLAVAQGLSGKTLDAMRTLNSMLAMRKHRPVSEFNLAAVYASLNRHVEAFYWLNQGIIHHDSLTAMVAVSPFFEPIRTDSRYPETLARIGLPYKK